MTKSRLRWFPPLFQKPEGSDQAETTRDHRVVEQWRPDLRLSLR